MKKNNSSCVSSSRCAEWLDRLNSSFKEVDSEQQKCLQEPQKVFSFIRVPALEVANQKNENSFNVQISSSSKLKLQGNSFAWYRNRNIPQISVMQSQSNLKQAKAPENYKFYASAFYCVQGKLIETELKGDNFKSTSNSSISFSCLKFQTTSYILSGSLVRVFVAIMNAQEELLEFHVSLPILITSWKNFLTDKPSKWAVFSPFMPICLKRAVGEESEEDYSVFRTLDTTEGFSDYFKGSTIKQKICHPLFVAITFPKIIKLHIPSQLFPSNYDSSSLKQRIQLLLNVQEFFVQRMSTKIANNQKIILEVKESGSSLLNEKVKCFLRSIYSDCLELETISEPNNSQYEGLKPISFENVPSSEWVQAYKDSFYDMEMMLVKSKMSAKQIQNQASFYSQKELPRLENIHSYSSRNSYSIPSVEVQLGKSFIEEESAMKSFPARRYSSILHQLSKKQIKLNQKNVSSSSSKPESFEESQQPELKKKVKKNSEESAKSPVCNLRLNSEVKIIALESNQPLKLKRSASHSNMDIAEEHSMSTRQIEKSSNSQLEHNSPFFAHSQHSDIVSPILQFKEVNINRENSMNNSFFNFPESSFCLNGSQQSISAQLPQLKLSNSVNSNSIPSINPLNFNGQQLQIPFALLLKQQQKLQQQQQQQKFQQQQQQLFDISQFQNGNFSQFSMKIPNQANFAFNFIQQQSQPSFNASSLQSNDLCRDLFLSSLFPRQFV